MRSVVALVALLWMGGPAFAADPSSLVATGRSDTEIAVQWDPGGNTTFSVDYLGPEFFGGAQPTCSDFPPHNDVLHAAGDSALITGLQPDTWYSIHVHAIDSGISVPTNLIIVKTLPAGSVFEVLFEGSPDYVICTNGGGGDGGGGGGDDDQGCAQLTFARLPGSLPVEEIQVTFVDPPSGGTLASFVVPIGVPQSVPEGVFHLRFDAPPGTSVTPVAHGLNVTCGEDITIRLRFRPTPPGRSR